MEIGCDEAIKPEALERHNWTKVLARPLSRWQDRRVQIAMKENEVTMTLSQAR